MYLQFSQLIPNYDIIKVYFELAWYPLKVQQIIFSHFNLIDVAYIFKIRHHMFILFTGQQGLGCPNFGPAGIRTRVAQRAAIY